MKTKKIKNRLKKGLLMTSMLSGVVGLNTAIYTEAQASGCSVIDENGDAIFICISMPNQTCRINANGFTLFCYDAQGPIAVPLP